METLELELSALLRDLRCSPRQARALSIRLGWDGGGGATLAAAASETGYTRERVRQLEERLRGRLVASGHRLPLTVRALDLIEALAPASREELGARLAAVGISEHPFDPAGVLRAAELTGQDRGIMEREGLVLRRPDGDLMRSARSAAARLARRTGAVRLRLVAARIEADVGTVRSLLDLLPGLRWLDPEREWLALPSPRSRPAKTIAKMLAVADELSLADVDDGLRRSAPPVLLPREVLRAYCGSLPWLAFDPERDSLRALDPPDPARVLTPLERSLVDVMRRHGGPLRLVEAARLAQAAGLNPTSAMLYISRSPAFRTVARGRYALRGPAPALAVAA